MQPNPLQTPQPKSLQRRRKPPPDRLRDRHRHRRRRDPRAGGAPCAGRGDAAGPSRASRSAGTTPRGHGEPPTIRQEGMDTVMPYHENADVLVYLNRARGSGVQVFLEIDRAVVRTGDPSSSRRGSRSTRPLPRCSGWYLADEPSTNPNARPDERRDARAPVPGREGRGPGAPRRRSRSRRATTCRASATPTTSRCGTSTRASACRPSTRAWTSGADRLEQRAAAAASRQAGLDPDDPGLRDEQLAAADGRRGAVHDLRGRAVRRHRHLLLGALPVAVELDRQRAQAAHRRGAPPRARAGEGPGGRTPRR